MFIYIWDIYAGVDSTSDLIFFGNRKFNLYDFLVDLGFANEVESSSDVCEYKFYNPS